MSEGAAGSGDLLSRARALESEGSYADVARMLEPVARETLLAEPELGYRLAYAWRRTGASADALRLCTDLDLPVRRSAADWLIRRRLNLEAMLRFDHGDVAGAAALWQAVVEHASAAGDQALLSAAHNNLGIVHTLHDHMEEAVAAYNRALLAARQTGDRRGAAQAHQNLAIIFREKRMPLEADAHFRQAAQGALAAASEDVRGRVEEERALLLLDLADVRMAEATAGRALRILKGINDVSGEGEAHRVLGIICLRRQENEKAREHLLRALDLAARAHNALLEAETFEAMAVLATRVDGTDAAHTFREQAEERFVRMHAEPWGRRIRARTTELAAPV
ncbi:MAG TPA: tetratricopeptide repeat protein [Longimicrobiales bacterium]|nr:tetratricopeptide repeat protein [Longimicrobiales bacterium]